MALVKQPAGGVAASGTIAGQVYARNRAGNYVRAWAKPVNPRTDKQTFVRNAFAVASTTWGMLTDAQIAQWDSYAAQLTRFNRLGEAYTPKGRQIYVETATNLGVVGMTALDVPATATDAPSFLLPLAMFTELTETADVIDAFTLATVVAQNFPGGGTGHYIVDATPPLDPKITNPAKYFRQIATRTNIDFNDGYEDDYNAAFGTPAAPVDKVIWVRVRLVDDATGLSSPAQIGSATVVAA